MTTTNQRYYVKHLYVASKYKGNELKDNVCKVTYSKTLREFNNWMEKIRKLDGDAYNYIQELDPKYWLRSHFNLDVKCDVLVNNLNGSWNSYNHKVWELPILQMLEWIRRKVMARL